MDINHAQNVYIYTMKVHVAWEHYIFTNADLLALQSVKPQARIFDLMIFYKGSEKLTRKDRTLNLFVDDHK